MGKDGLGEFEHLVLLAILALGHDAYGVAILDELERRAGRRVTRAAIYVALRRLEEKGWVRSELGEPTAERGGRAKRFFRVTPAALARLRRTRATLIDFWAAIPQLKAK
jgi:PadR family transcriptional regulator PadR